MCVGGLGLGRRDGGVDGIRAYSLSQDHTRSQRHTHTHIHAHTHSHTHAYLQHAVEVARVAQVVQPRPDLKPPLLLLLLLLSRRAVGAVAVAVGAIGGGGKRALPFVRVWTGQREEGSHRLWKQGRRHNNATQITSICSPVAARRRPSLPTRCSGSAARPARSPISAGRRTLASRRAASSPTPTTAALVGRVRGQGAPRPARPRVAVVDPLLPAAG